MNFLFVSSEYPPETGNGGIATYTRITAEELARQGHTVTVIAASTDTHELFIRSNGVTIHRIPSVPYPLPKMRYAFHLRKLLTFLFPHTLQRLSRSIAVRNKVRYLLRRIPPFDIIEAPECGAESLFIPRRAARSLVIRLHTPWQMISTLDNLKEAPGDRILLPFLERLAIRRATAVSSPSHALATRMSTLWNLPMPTIIPNPMPAEPCPLTSGGGWIFTGRVERRKGVHHLISAYIRIYREFNQVPPLTIIGRAYGTDSNGRDYATVIRQKIISSEIKTAIRWIDHLPHDMVTEHLCRSSVAFFPSLWENFPYACLEAMSCGCAVIASHCGGFPEIIDDEINGILVPVDSSHALYVAMKRFIDQPQIAVRLGSTARQRVEELCNPRRICNEMLAFYRSTLEVHP